MIQKSENIAIASLGSTFPPNHPGILKLGAAVVLMGQFNERLPGSVRRAPYPDPSPKIIDSRQEFFSPNLILFKKIKKNNKFKKLDLRGGEQSGEA